MFMPGYSGPKAIKEQLEYADTLFMQINRIADIASQPDLNLTQFSISVDILATMVSFIEKINFSAKENMTPTDRYEKALVAFEKCLDIMNKKNLLFKYTIKGHIGNKEKQ